MGKLFGRTSCNEERDWCVVADVIEEECVLTEQLNESEAKKFYEELKEEIEKNKTGFIEVVKDGGEYSDKTYLLNLKNVEKFRLYRS